MAKYKKKPVVIEAEQFWPDKNPLPLNTLGPFVCFDGDHWYVTSARGRKTYLEGGDWVILEAMAGAYASRCKPDIFEATYEPA